MRPETAHQVVLLSLFVGLGFALFSAYETLVPAARGYCTVNLFFSCSAVDQSAFSSTLGIPDWAIGIAGYVALLALDIPLYRNWKRPMLLALTGLSAVGLAVSLYFGYVEL